MEQVLMFGETSPRLLFNLLFYFFLFFLEPLGLTVNMLYLR